MNSNSMNKCKKVANHLYQYLFLYYLGAMLILGILKIILHIEYSILLPTILKNILHSKYYNLAAIIVIVAILVFWFFVKKCNTLGSEKKFYVCNFVVPIITTISLACEVYLPEECRRLYILFVWALVSIFFSYYMFAIFFRVRFSKVIIILIVLYCLGNFEVNQIAVITALCFIADAFLLSSNREVMLKFLDKIGLLKRVRNWLPEQSGEDNFTEEEKKGKWVTQKVCTYLIGLICYYIIVFTDGFNLYTKWGEKYGHFDYILFNSDDVSTVFNFIGKGLIRALLLAIVFLLIKRKFKREIMDIFSR